MKPLLSLSNTFDKAYFYFYKLISIRIEKGNRCLIENVPRCIYNVNSYLSDIFANKFQYCITRFKAVTSYSLVVAHVGSLAEVLAISTNSLPPMSSILRRNILSYPYSAETQTPISPVLWHVPDLSLD